MTGRTMVAVAALEVNSVATEEVADTTSTMARPSRVLSAPICRAVHADRPDTPEALARQRDQTLRIIMSRDGGQNAQSALVYTANLTSFI